MKNTLFTSALLAVLIYACLYQRAVNTRLLHKIIYLEEQLQKIPQTQKKQDEIYFVSHEQIKNKLTNIKKTDIRTRDEIIKRIDWLRVALMREISARKQLKKKLLDVQEERQKKDKQFILWKESTGTAADTLREEIHRYEENLRDSETAIRLWMKKLYADNTTTKQEIQKLYIRSYEILKGTLLLQSKMKKKFYEEFVKPKELAEVKTAITEIIKSMNLMYENKGLIQQIVNKMQSVENSNAATQKNCNSNVCEMFSLIQRIRDTEMKRLQHQLSNCLREQTKLCREVKILRNTLSAHKDQQKHGQE